MEVVGDGLYNIPMDVISDVLSRLPVKSLLRFRCVSKPWLSLIDSRNFIKLHLDQSARTRSNQSLLVLVNNYDGKTYMCLLDPYRPDDTVQLLDLPLRSNPVFGTRIADSDLPLRSNPVFGTRIADSIHGLVCMFNRDGVIAIWNPSTRNLKKMPVPPIVELPVKFDGTWEENYRFGYDSVSDDYKVVRIVVYTCLRSTPHPEVRVYSLKTNSWGRVHDFPYYPKLYSGVFANNALHWVATIDPWHGFDVLIAAFDLAVEEYRLLPQPEFQDKNFLKYVGELEGRLCFLCNYCGFRIDVWVMEEYGVKESWSKLLSIAETEVNYPYRHVTPLAYSKNGCEVLLVHDQSRRLIRYDLKREKVIDIHDLSKTIDPRTKLIRTKLYVESLVPLDDGGGAADLLLSGGGENGGKNLQANKRRKGRGCRGRRKITTTMTRNIKIKSAT